jgi:hypothetical protein
MIVEFADQNLEDPRGNDRISVAEIPVTLIRHVFIANQISSDVVASRKKKAPFQHHR